MNLRKTIALLARLSRFGLAVLFLFAVGAKLYFLNDPEYSFVRNMPELVGPGWAWPVAIGVISAESLAVVLLLLRRTFRWGGALAGGLLLVFAGYALYYRFGLHREGLECGCFGRLIASQLGVSTALRNLLLLIPCGLVTFGPGKPSAAVDGTPEPAD